MRKAKVLKLSEAIQYDRKVIWMEMRETAGVFPVTFYAEHVPFLRFDCEDRPLMVEVRAEYYGKTWRCWSDRPNGQPVPGWKDPEGAAEPAVNTGAGKQAKAKMGAQIAADVRKAAAGKKPPAGKTGGAKK